VKIQHKLIRKEHEWYTFNSVSFIIKVNGQEYSAYELYRNCDEYHYALYLLALAKKTLIERLKDKGEIV
jgi:hypothetical protein